MSAETRSPFTDALDIGANEVMQSPVHISNRAGGRHRAGPDERVAGQGGQG